MNECLHNILNTFSSWCFTSNVTALAQTWLQLKEEKRWITKVSMSKPLGTTNVFTKCPDSPKLLRHFNHKSELHCTASGKPLKASGFTLWGPRKIPWKHFQKLRKFSLDQPDRRSPINLQHDWKQTEPNWSWIRNVVPHRRPIRIFKTSRPGWRLLLLLPWWISHLAWPYIH